MFTTNSCHMMSMQPACADPPSPLPIGRHHRAWSFMPIDTPPFNCVYWSRLQSIAAYNYSYIEFIHNL